MKRHVVVVHEGRKRFKCEICNAEFGQKSDLNKHVAVVHEGKKQFTCDICNSEFGQKGTLKQHVVVVHEGNKQCEICNRNFENTRYNSP